MVQIVISKRVIRPLLPEKKTKSTKLQAKMMRFATITYTILCKC